MYLNTLSVIRPTSGLLLISICRETTHGRVLYKNNSKYSKESFIDLFSFYKRLACVKTVVETPTAVDLNINKI